MTRVVDRLRRIGAHPMLEPAVALIMRGWATRSPLAFVARELARRGGCFRYELREFPGRSVLVRHGTGDVVTLGEVFRNFDYRPPPEVAEALGGGGPRRVVDLGANVGYAGAYLSGLWPGCRIDAWEPDPANAAIHEAMIGVEGEGARWHVTRAAAGARSGEARFISGEVALSRLAEVDMEGSAGSDVIDVEVVDVLPAIADVDLLKMDIEGGEWAIISDQRFAAAPPRCLVMEYHPEGCPGIDPPAAVRGFLEGAGLTVGEVGRSPHGAGMVWAWREL
jgi:FkbM family methyltransferase